MIFLVVKVNCPLYDFSISKSIQILMNIKKLGNFRKAPESAHPMICLILQVMMSQQVNKR